MTQALPHCWIFSLNNSGLCWGLHQPFQIKHSKRKRCKTLVVSVVILGRDRQLNERTKRFPKEKSFHNERHAEETFLQSTEMLHIWWYIQRRIAHTASRSLVPAFYHHLAVANCTRQLHIDMHCLSPRMLTQAFVECIKGANLSFPVSRWQAKLAFPCRCNSSF